MIVLPDLFGAYQKGRETAIEANWNDLKNYETVESMRTRNDRDALQLLADQADYNINRSMMRDNGDVSALNAALAKEQFHRDYYNALIDAQVGKAQYGTTMSAAADGRLQDLANKQFETTYNNGGTNVANSWVNLTDATARQRGLSNNLDAYYSLINNTVADNIVAGQQVITTNQATRPLNHATTVANANTTRNQALSAWWFSNGQVQDPDAITRTGFNRTKGNYTASKINAAANENALDDILNQPEAARQAKLAQLLDQRTSLLQNIQLAAQQGDTVTVESMKEQYAANEAEIARLSGKSQPSLASKAVDSVLGVAPITQVPSTPAIQTPAGQPPPSSPRNPALSNLFPKGSLVSPTQSGGAGSNLFPYKGLVSPKQSGGAGSNLWPGLANNAGVWYTGGSR